MKTNTTVTRKRLQNKNRIKGSNTVTHSLLSHIKLSVCTLIVTQQCLLFHNLISDYDKKRFCLWNKICVLISQSNRSSVQTYIHIFFPSHSSTVFFYSWLLNVNDVLKTVEKKNSQFHQCWNSMSYYDTILNVRA